MTRDLYRIGENYDFANARAPSFNQFFKLMSAAMVTGSPLREQLCWTDDFPVPLIDNHFVRKYVSRATRLERYETNAVTTPVIRMTPKLPNDLL